jgi:glycosyltransferase involved in cell wall biosynthesis
MKISILIPDLRGGGAERVMVDLGREFHDLGHKVDFVLMQSIGDFLDKATEYADVHELKADRARNVSAKLAEYLGKAKPDLLIANMWPLTCSAVVGRLISRTPCRLLLVEHSTLSQQYASWGVAHLFMLRASMSLIYRFADKVSAVSQGAASDTADLALMARNRVHVLHNPIPTRDWPSPSSIAFAEQLWDCPRGSRILTVGNLKDQKNHRLLIEAFSRMSPPDARLLLLGRGDNRSVLESLSQELGVADRVVFAGFFPDPSPFYATADLFALSSDYEGLPTVMIEALSFGLPVVSTDCPSGPSEILGDGRWGRLVPVRDPAALAEAMTIALASPIDRDAQKARAADFAPAIAAQRYLSLMGLA